MRPTLVVPSNIPWEAVKGRQLEECVYWLLESLGAKQIDWRLGGSGAGAADGGRDLECVFNVPEPSGDVLRQQWWVEAKGRNSTVSPSDIKASVHTVAGKAHVDVHLIVTNQQLTNPTKDWLREWKQNHRRPDVRVWERHDLERLVTRNPVVAVRLFPKALTPEGKGEVMSTRFWDYVGFTDVPTLKTLWRERERVSWNHRSMFAALASECATGNLTLRPWGYIIPNNQLLSVYLNALVNSFYLLFRADAAGVRFDPIIDALAHLLIHLTARFDPQIVSRITERFSEFAEGLPDIPSEARRLIVDPVVRTAFHHVADACMSDCCRVSGDRLILNEDDAKEFWKRFRMPADSSNNEEPSDNSSILLIESHTARCNAGLHLSKDIGCPLTNYDDAGATLEEKLRAIRPVVISRTGLQPVNDS